MTQTTWLDTKSMAKVLGIHPQTLKTIRNTSSIFKRGRDFRNTGLSTRGPLQWHPENTEKSFTFAKRIPPQEVETFSEVSC